MTLALAMFCDGGLMLAADTRFAYQDGSVADMSKITGFQCRDGIGTYVIVHSAQDANAANSLIGDIRQGLENNRFPESLPSIEATIKMEMQKWYVPNDDDRPIIQLLVGASIQKQSQRILYLCEPPNTVSRVYENYKAIGDGWHVSDWIYEWYKERAPWSPHACLCQISYMMYRAKKMLPGTIGGNTDVGFITEPATVPYWIQRLDMEDAERRGRVFDGLIAQFAPLVIPGVAGGAKAISEMGEQIYQFDLHYATLAFRCQFADKTIRY